VLIVPQKPAFIHHSQNRKDSPVGLFSSILEKLGFNQQTEPTKPSSAFDPTSAPKPTVEKPAAIAISEVDVVGKLENLAASNPQKLNWKTSIVDLLKLLGMDSSLEARKELATELGCPPEKMRDSAQMNIWLHKAVLQKLAENGATYQKSFSECPMSCNVLLVEDEPIARRNIAYALEDAGHNVYPAESGEAAFHLLTRVTFDCVISDFRLPGRVNGLDVLKHQNAIAPGRRLLLVTAFSSEYVRSETESLGAVYMEKPLAITDILSVVTGH
jgi:CheY-like chemotaxis protein